MSVFPVWLSPIKLRGYQYPSSASHPALPITPYCHAVDVMPAAFRREYNGLFAIGPSYHVALHGKVYRFAPLPTASDHSVALQALLQGRSHLQLPYLPEECSAAHMSLP